MEKKLTQQQLGELIGVDNSYMSRIEQGQKNISLQTISKLAKALEVSEADFFTYVSKTIRKSHKEDDINEIVLELYKLERSSLVKLKPLFLELIKQFK